MATTRAPAPAVDSGFLKGRGRPCTPEEGGGAGGMAVAIRS